jgi:GH35 family endo-1,4-beta-xylanase
MIGSAFNLWNAESAAYNDIVEDEFSITVAEHDCKWVAMRPSKDVYNIDRCVNHLKVAVANNQKFRGHTLCWGNLANPKWLENIWNADELDTLLKDHINYVMKEVPKQAGANNGQLIAWDVVNEAVGNDGKFK